MTLAGISETPAPGERWAVLKTFIRLDRVGVVVGLAFVAIANGVVVKDNGVWAIVPFLILLVFMLTAALAALDRGRLFFSIGLVAVGNWIVAGAVAALFPFLWPVMILTVVMPLVLATPYLGQQHLVVLLAGSALAGGLTAVLGLLADDGGVIPDIDDALELILVSGALAVHMVPIALIVRQNNRLQRQALTEAQQLNRSLRESEAAVAASRLRIVEAGDRERSRIERDLHDGAQQRLLAVGLQLRALQAAVDSDSQAYADVGAIHDELGAAVNELRELAHGIYPPVLQMHGLTEAIHAVARRSSNNVTMQADSVGRFDPSIERAAYFAAMEALTNVEKHAPTASVEVQIHTTLPETAGEIAELRLTVSDDGSGFDPVAASGSHGLFNMADRITAVGGRLTVDSSPGSGTTVAASIPLEPRPAEA